jgi:hypothetical protein
MKWLLVNVRHHREVRLGEVDRPRNNYQEQAHMYPAEEAELLLEVSSFERGDETNKA